MAPWSYTAEYALNKKIADILRHAASVLSIAGAFFVWLGRSTMLTTRPAITAIGAIPRYRHTDYGLLVTSSALGIIVGLLVVVFHEAMEVTEHWFDTIFSAADELITFTKYIFPLIPMLGGLAVGVLNTTVFRNLHGEGLELVTESLARKNGRISWRNAVKAIVTAALSISSGGGAGREGPTVVLGASIGSAFAQVVQLRPQQVRVLCGAGTAAAISAIFNAPLGGLVFAMEIVIGELNIRSFIPLVISSVLATATARLFLGHDHIIAAPSIVTVPLEQYALLALVGMLSGGVALYYLKAYRFTFQFTRRSLHPVSPMIRPAIGGFFVGLLVLVSTDMLEITYTPINRAISGNDVGLWGLLLALFVVVMKPISNAITLGSGGAGGTLAPALKVGVLFGFIFGTVLHYFVPSTNVGLYAFVAGGAVLAGTYRAPLTGAITVFQISGNHDLLLPLLFSSVFATFVINRANVQTFNPLTSLDEEHKRTDNAQTP